MPARKAKKLQTNLSSRKHRKKMDAIAEQLGNAITYHQAGRLQEAESLYQSILQLQPDNADALHLLGVIAYQVGKYEISAKLIAHSIAINPNFAESHNNLGNALMALGQYDEALQCYELTLKLKPEYVEAHASIGNYYREKSQQTNAISYYKQALSLNPNYAEAHNNLAVVLEETGCHDDAIKHYRQAININPQYCEAHNNLGNSLRSKEFYNEAINFYEKALNLNPNYFAAYINLGNVYKDINKYGEAIQYYQKALSINPDYAETHNNLGVVYQVINRIDDAIACYEKAINLNAEYADAYNNLGIIYQDTGRKNDAIDLYKKALDINPENAEANHHLAIVEPDKEKIKIIETLLETREYADKERMHLYYALGTLCNKFDYFDDAFKHFSIANSIKRKSIHYDSENHSTYIDSLIKVFSNDYFDKKVSLENSTEQPVFIVGMPRSGTTLVEQIVSSHPKVFGAGELTELRYIEAELNEYSHYPKCILEIDSLTINKHSARYITKTRSYSETALRITDKMPSNFLRIGLIKTLFPNAYIIHCKRNPFDTCSSIYTTYFAEGNQHTYDLEELAKYYLDYEKLMVHWKEVFGSQILDVQYEELVRNQEVISKQLIEYLGLEWDNQCITFYKNERTVKTASNLQVRKPIYSNSINRWEKYEKQLEPLRKILNT